jgi:hypothetical protein
MNKMSDLNANAKEFYPQWAKDEDKFFDELEKRFMERNAWIFEDNESIEYKEQTEYKSEYKFNQALKEQSKPKTYAEVAKRSE